jgi:SAM-dependent methyltransferase
MRRWVAARAVREDAGMSADRTRLRGTFDTAARRYHQARPDYPEALFDALLTATGTTPGQRVLEVGCGTGKATLPLARRGLAVTCVELGPALATEARRRLARHPRVEVLDGDFEQVPERGRFDLVCAATAWRWVDPALRYRRAHGLLHPGGHLAFWSATHVFPDGGDPFFAEIQPVYEEIGAAPPTGAARPRPHELPDECAEIEAGGLFEVSLVRRFDWEVRYRTGEYLALLDTFSGHIAMRPEQRAHLYAEIRRRLAARPDGSLRRRWGAVLHIARRRPDPREC